MSGSKNYGAIKIKKKTMVHLYNGILCRPQDHCVSLDPVSEGALRCNDTMFCLNVFNYVTVYGKPVE